MASSSASSQLMDQASLSVTPSWMPCYTHCLSAQPCSLHSIRHICQREAHKYILCDPCFIQLIQMLVFSVHLKLSDTWTEGRGNQITKHHRENTQNQVLKPIKSRMSPRQGGPRKGRGLCGLPSSLQLSSNPPNPL